MTGHKSKVLRNISFDFIKERDREADDIVRKMGSNEKQSRTNSCRLQGIFKVSFLQWNLRVSSINDASLLKKDALH